MFKFTIETKDKKSKARAGKLETPHGEILTPNFNPVGTQAAVKTLSSQDLKDIGAQIVLSNSYHLMLRPGADVIEKMGGLAKFMGWGTFNRSFEVGDEKSLTKNSRHLDFLRSNNQDPTSHFSHQEFVGSPTMTDSGGFQVFSLGVAQKKVIFKDASGRRINKFTKSVFLSPADTQFLLPAIAKTREAKQLIKLKAAKIHEDGVWFYSHIDGSKRWFDANVSIKLQEQLGADLFVAFDDHESPLWDYEMTRFSLERTNRWALQSRVAHKRKDQLMYGVVHGGMYDNLRIESAKFTEKHFEAIAIGGSYSSKETLYRTVESVISHVSPDKPVHLLGIGEVQDIFEAIERGVDFFDCVAPTRRGRHGNLYISPKNGGSAKQNYTLQITNAKYALDKDPIDPGCLCFTCQNHTRAYLRHLFMGDELLAQRLGSYHNVYFIVNLVKKIREAILEGRFQEMKKVWL
ncbi:MAG TPA: tRNA guanosine(34) transglycosylase Tgt [Patescibacteria group bacterium]|nr:tRNA guanosine(34) transglycosylase Tgt [Patescibacteria group bacterium]